MLKSLLGTKVMLPRNSLWTMTDVEKQERKSKYQRTYDQELNKVLN